MTSLLIRVALYAAVLFLIMVVYVGQQHDTAPTILKDSVHKTGKFLWWTLILVAVMELSFWLFVD